MHVFDSLGLDCKIMIFRVLFKCKASVLISVVTMPFCKNRHVCLKLFIYLLNTNSERNERFPTFNF